MPKEWEGLNSSGMLESKKGWELVDGQQRLTTIRILFTYLNEDFLRPNELKEYYSVNELFSIDYETRPKTRKVLETGRKLENDIDSYHITEAFETIKKWVQNKVDSNPDIKKKDVCDRLINTLVYSQKNRKAQGIVQVIWYEIKHKPIHTFIRINLGKIALTNSELIKALFLQKSNFGEDQKSKSEIGKLRQLEIAGDWDRIENTLQNEDFWWFLNKNENLTPARIEFIFDLIKEVAIENDEEPKIREDLSHSQIEERKKTNPTVLERVGDDKYSTFRYFYSLFDESKGYEFVKEKWNEIKRYFDTLYEWYNNPIWYHYVGFLIYINKNTIVRDLCIEHKRITNDIKGCQETFTDFLIKRIKVHFKKLKWNHDADGKVYLDLAYKDPKVKELLLLFNLQYIVRQSQNETMIYKFPFKKFKEDRWDIEHIDSFTENKLEDLSEQIDWINTAIRDAVEIVDHPQLTERLRAFIEKRSGEKFEILKQEISLIIEEELNNEILKNNIGNLTLLSEEINRSYGNSLFPTKRKVIIENDRYGNFIPICTKNVFLKYFDLDGGSKTKWTENDIKKYRDIICDELDIFLSKPKITSDEEV
jgi:hypothetical protein